MERTAIKVAGASGQGINSVGSMIAKGLKRAGYQVFGYREYPSLIKGGHATYQVDVSDSEVKSTQSQIAVLLAANHHALRNNVRDVQDRGLILHTTPDWAFSVEQQAFIEERLITVRYLPADHILRKLGAGGLLSNSVMLGHLWSLLEQDIRILKTLVAEKFKHRPKALCLNDQCLDAGYSCKPLGGPTTISRLPGPPSRDVADRLLLSGSEAMGLGALHAGMRLFAAYPMTPASPLLSFFAGTQDKTRIVLKQAEDEITAAQMTSGAMFMGTRAMTATSGAGFDLMSETLSMNAMIENPAVFVLAQRPGPATGLPTWTAQGDLLLAAHAGHGEFSRCVLAVSDAQDAFDLMPVAFNIAERYQTVVVVLTEKQIADAMYTQPRYDQEKAFVDRGRLIIDPASLCKLETSDRYDPSVPNGVSARWLPGSKAAPYCAQADEHDAAGVVTEAAHVTKQQMDKRRRKFDAMKAALPDPIVYRTGKPLGRSDAGDGSDHLELLIVGWGSSGSVIRDVMACTEMRDRSVGYLHFTYLWPLRTETLQRISGKAQKVVLVEQNMQGQLGVLIRSECGLHIADRILKYDGRPFFYEELLSLLMARLGPLKGAQQIDLEDHGEYGA